MQLRSCIDTGFIVEEKARAAGGRGSRMRGGLRAIPQGTELSRMGDVELSMPSPMPFGPDGHRHAEQDSRDAHEEPDRR